RNALAQFLKNGLGTDGGAFARRRIPGELPTEPPHSALVPPLFELPHRSAGAQPANPPPRQSQTLYATALEFNREVVPNGNRIGCAPTLLCLLNGLASRLPKQGVQTAIDA